VPNSLNINVNTGGRDSLDVPDSFETSEGFDVVLVNHGGATHVNLRLDDALSEQLTLEAPNHHIAGGTERRVSVSRTASAAAHGYLEVITDHGAKSRVVEIALTEPLDADEGVATVGPETDRAVREADGLSGTPEQRDDTAIELRLGADGTTATADGAPASATADGDDTDSADETATDGSAAEGRSRATDSATFRPAERRALTVGSVAVLSMGLTTGVVVQDRSAILVVTVLGACAILAAVAVNRLASSNN